MFESLQWNFFNLNELAFITVCHENGHLLHTLIIFLFGAKITIPHLTYTLNSYLKSKFESCTNHTGKSTQKWILLVIISYAHFIGKASCQTKTEYLNYILGVSTNLWNYNALSKRLPDLRDFDIFIVHINQVPLFTCWKTSYYYQKRLAKEAQMFLFSQTINTNTAVKKDASTDK